MTAAYRWALAASLTLGAALYGYIIVRGRADQRDADDLEVLRALADGRPVDLPNHWRIAEAVLRLVARGELTRAIPGRCYLTRAGWARVGRPLSEDDRRSLRAFAAGSVLVPGTVSRIQELRRSGLIRGWDLTAAGRAALEGASS